MSHPSSRLCVSSRVLLRWWQCRVAPASTHPLLLSSTHRLLSTSSSAAQRPLRPRRERPPPSSTSPSIASASSPRSVTPRPPPAASPRPIPALPAISFPRLSAAELREYDDEEEAATPAAVHRQLEGLNSIAGIVAAEREAADALSAEGEGEEAKAAVAVVKKKEETLRSSYSSLLKAAHRSFRLHARSFTPLRPPSSMSPHLRVLERVWHSMVRHSQPNVTHFTDIVDAYGREARRSRIRDLYTRWKEEQQRAMGKGQEEDNGNAAPPPGISPAEAEQLKAREQRAKRARLLRETAAGFPVHRSLYPAVRLDTVAYNAIIAAYTASLAVETLTPASRELTFPLSLLPSFRPDARTYTTLMSLHCRMRETGSVLQLYDEFQSMRRGENAQLHGQRPLQAVRAQRKEEAQYVHSILLRTLGQAGEVDAAERLWAELHEKEAQNRIALNRPLYHAMLELYASQNAHEKMRALSVEMKRRNMAMDEHGVCTVIHALCRAGHVDDAVMIHRRLAQGSLGLAKPHRQTYIALLSHLCTLPSVSFSRVAAVFAEGIEGGWLRSPSAHRQKWVVDVRLVPLPLLEVSVQWHLQSMLSAFMELWRKEGRKAAVDSIPQRGLLILLGKSRQERERDEQSVLRVGVSGNDEEYQPHAMSISALDPDAEVEEGGEEGEARPKAAAVVLVDPFATEEEAALLARLDEWQVKGSFVQRYVQHLLQHEWPSLRARLPEDGAAADGRDTPSSTHASSPDIDASSPSLLMQAPSTPTSSLLKVHRTEVEFWLCTQAHIQAERTGEGELFPAPRLHGASRKWMEKLKQRAAEVEEERKKESGVSLVERLNAWKRREREALEAKARVFNTKRPPMQSPALVTPRPRRAASAATPTQQPRAADDRQAAPPQQRSRLQPRASSSLPSSLFSSSSPRSRARAGSPARRSSPPPSNPSRPAFQLSSSTLSALLRSSSSASLSPGTRAIVEDMAGGVQPRGAEAQKAEAVEYRTERAKPAAEATSPPRRQQRARPV